MNFFKYFLLVLAFVGFGALIGAPSAKAASPYDHILQIQEPDNLHINGQSGFTTSDLGYWLVTVSVSDGCSPYDREVIVNALENGNDYAITQVITSNVLMYVDISNEGLPDPIFDISSSTHSLSIPPNSKPYKLISFSNYQGIYRYSCSDTVNGFILSTSNSDYKLAEYRGFSINYPQDYEGEILQPVQPAKIPADYWINFTFTNSTDQVQAKYSNYNTDPSPLPLLPQPKTIWWHIYQDDPTVANGTSVCDIDLRVDIPFNSLEHCPDFKPYPSKKYYLTTDINPTTRLNEEVFTDSLAYDLTFKRSNFLIDFTKPTVGSTEFCTPGAMYNNDAIMCAEPKKLDLSTCFTETFPFISLNDCLDNFEVIFNYITFQAPRFPEWKHQSQCHSLNILDDWLGLPQGYQVCPQIPEYVRNITSPFVAFLLGLVTVGFITKHNKDIS